MRRERLSDAQVAALEALASDSLASVRAGTLASLVRRGFIARVQNGHELLLAGRDLVAALHPDPLDADVDESAGPQGLHARGSALWARLQTDCDLAGGGRALAEEACRIADRLDRLDDVLRGREHEWMTVRVPRDGGDLVLVVDGALAEARQQATALRQLIAGLPLKGDDDDGDDASGFVDGLGVPT